MIRRTLLVGFTAILMMLAMSSDVQAWYAYHYGGYRGGGYHYSGYHYSGYHYGGYHYGGYGYGGAHYGYYRRW